MAAAHTWLNEWPSNFALVRGRTPLLVHLVNLFSSAYLLFLTWQSRSMFSSHRKMWHGRSQYRDLLVPLVPPMHHTTNSLTAYFYTPYIFACCDILKLFIILVYSVTKHQRKRSALFAIVSTAALFRQCFIVHNTVSHSLDNSVWMYTVLESDRSVGNAKCTKRHTPNLRDGSSTGQTEPNQ